MKMLMAALAVSTLLIGGTTASMICTEASAQGGKTCTSTCSGPPGQRTCTRTCY